MPPQPPAGGPPQPPAYPPAGGPQQPASQPPRQPGVYPSQTPQPAYAGAYTPAVAAVAPVRYRTGWVLFAQILMVLRGIFWMLAGGLIIAAGVYLIINGTSKIQSLPQYSQYASTISSYLNAIVGVAIGVGAFLLIIGLIGLILGVIVGRPSNGARWTIVVLTILSALWWLFVTLAGLGNHNTTSGWLFGLVFFVIDLIVLYALLINGHARRGFAGRPPGTP